jgi:hypothetical protein
MGDGMAAGAVEVYSEAAAVITVLILLGQVLDLRAREQTSGAPGVLGSDVPHLPRPLLLNSRTGGSHPRPPDSSASLHGSPS